MTQTMRERLIAAVKGIVVLDDSAAPGVRPSQESAEEIIDAIFAAFYSPDDYMLRSMIADLGAVDDPGTRRLYVDVLQTAADHVTGDGIDLELAGKPHPIDNVSDAVFAAISADPKLTWGKK